MQKRVERETAFMFVYRCKWLLLDVYHVYDKLLTIAQNHLNVVSVLRTERRGQKCNPQTDDA